LIFTSFRPHIQQTLLEIEDVMPAGQDIAISGADDFYSRINEVQVLTTKRRNRGYGSEDHASASGLVCKQKDDISNIFLN